MTDIADLPPPPAASAEWAYFLDFDGTLVDFAPTPDGVEADGVGRLLDRLDAETGGAVAIVTGRRLDDLDARLGGHRTAAAGLHGLERRFGAGAAVETVATSADTEAVRAELHAAAAPLDGVVIEDKGPAVALHYRQAPHLQNRLEQSAAAAVGAHRGFTVLAGNMVFEVKPADVDKGHAVEAFLARPPFAGRRPVYLGDDITDEDGFEAVNRRGGVSVLVGRRTPSRARHAIADVAGVRAWLGAVTRRRDSA